jgi:UDP-N-acetylmuramate--alanine ligase
MFGKARRIHFVGIGGIGMSGIAEVLLNLGFEVSGSDVADSAVTRRLAGLGARVTRGHAAANLTRADVVVISSAVRPDNPEVVAAKERGVPVVPRAEMLSELMRLKDGIAVAGAHGKTTTTSMVARVLGEAGLDPTSVIGGRFDAIGSNARLGQGRYLVAEADESDGTFLLLSPTIAVVTNIDLEHLDFYRDLAHIRETFLTFVNKVPFFGLAVLCLDCEHVQALLPRVRKRAVTYGMTGQSDWRAEGIVFDGPRTSFDVVHRDRGTLGRIDLAMPGLHTVYNALAACAVADELEVPFDVTRRALDGFRGVHRRFDVKGEADGVLVVDDYGHHPTEIKATLAAARGGFARRLVVAFQPHRYSRAQALFGEFLSAFNAADVLVLTEIYPAGESPIAGVSGEALACAVRDHGFREVRFVPARDDVAAALAAIARPGDLVLTLGAGNITKCADELIALLRAREGSA